MLSSNVRKKLGKNHRDNISTAACYNSGGSLYFLFDIFRYLIAVIITICALCTFTGGQAVPQRMRLNVMTTQ